MVGQGPAVLAAGTGLKLFECLGVFIFLLKRGFARKWNGDIFFLFGIFL